MSVSISLHCIFHADGVFKQELVKDHSLITLPGRRDFIVDIVKIATWIVSQTGPLESFHLASGIRTKTRIGHYVTLLADGILKEFGPKSSASIPLDIIKRVYYADLLNVERGHINSAASVTIKSVGRTLKDTLRLRHITKENARIQVEQAVKQLHSIGVAHCDICVDNLFVDVVDNVLFLGDLEYCHLKDDPPPTELRRSDDRAATAAELDLLQLDKIKGELALL